jgi:Zn-dependent protease with chaperone function
MQNESNFAQYFDGISTNAQRVTPTLKDSELVLSTENGELRRASIADIKLSVNQAATYAIGYFADGASVQLSDAELIAKIKPNKTLSDSLAQNWRSAGLTVLLLVAVVFSIYRFGIPALADASAKYVPDSWAQSIEDSVINDLDGNMCKPTKLSEARQTELREKFNELQLAADKNRATEPIAELLFRDCKLMGPNAFNMGREKIALLDEMVTFAETDDAIIGVLAHELGHLHADHVMRGILRYAGVGALSAVLLGDVSAIVAAAPAFVLRNQYTQVFEREADAYALAKLKAANLPTQPLADMFRKLSKHGKTKEAGSEGQPEDKNKKNEKGKNWEWLFSHPDSDERAKLFDQ